MSDKRFIQEFNTEGIDEIDTSFADEGEEEK